MTFQIRDVSKIRPVVLLGLALLVGAPAYAQNKSAEIDKIFSWATPDAPGCAVAVSLNGKQVVNRAYGLADLERNVPLSPDTVFDVGSFEEAICRRVDFPPC